MDGPAELVRLASRRARSFGASSVADLCAAARVPEAEARAALVGSAGAEFLDDDWFWLPGARPNRLAATVRGILAVSSPLDVPTIRAGVGRTLRSAQDGRLPPAGVLSVFFRVHPAFAMDALGRVRGAYALDYAIELNTTDRTFVDVLRSSWTGVLERAPFREACAARGMSPRTFDRRARCSAVLDNPTADLWCLRGTRVSAVTAAALRYARTL